MGPLLHSQWRSSLIVTRTTAPITSMSANPAQKTHVWSKNLGTMFMPKVLAITVAGRRTSDTVVSTRKPLLVRRAVCGTTHRDRG